VTSLHLAIDLGAGSGRAILGSLAADGLVIREVHRFHYQPRQADGHLRWDMTRLVDGLTHGIERAVLEAALLGQPLASVGVDSWGVDYALVDASGRLVEEPICYRDGRTAGAVDAVLARLPRARLFERTGIQFLPFNTLFQLAAHVRAGLPSDAVRLLMIPDFCHHVLCGSTATEHTNASTTQLLRAGEMAWDETVCAAAGLLRSLLPDIVPAGTPLGTLTPRWQKECGAGPLQVIAPATHDTASAVAGTPLEPGWAYISSGTWSLVGIERDRPLVAAAVGEANFTNEAGAFGTVRFLKNVMGLWILEACRREWSTAGLGMAYQDLLEQSSQLPGFVGFVFPDDPRFFNPPSMIEEVRAALAETGQPAHQDPVRLTRVILDSLALRYAEIVRTIERLDGRPVPGIHIVGGGSLNEYLNQATADAAARPVTAGPAEATAIGNVLVQSIASGELASLGEARRLLALHLPLRQFQPRDVEAWAAATERFAGLERT
jgi:rhamnulokinase